MIDQAFQAKIKTLYTTHTVAYANGQGLTAPYHVMIKIFDDERSSTQCYEQGDSGEAVFQFSTYAGEDPTLALTKAEALKNIVKDIDKIIVTDGTNNYRINYNMTTSVTVIGDGFGSLGVWGVIFTTTIKWEKL